ncbi:MAG: hypothetical protein ABWZ76_11395 [Acidimicrobiales bacterium]
MIAMRGDPSVRAQLSRSTSSWLAVAGRALLCRAPVSRYSSLADPLAKTGLAKTGLAKTGLAKTGLAKTGLAKTGLAETGLAWGVPHIVAGWGGQQSSQPWLKNTWLGWLK